MTYRIHQAIAALFISSLAYNPLAMAAPISQTSIAVTNPGTTIAAGNDNGLEPQKPYIEHATSGGPQRNPLKYEKLTAKPYPTNKWFIDIAFESKFRGFNKKGEPMVDQFRVDQSPLTLRVLDSFRLDGAKEIVEWPGLMITAPKKPYLIVNGAKNPMFADTLQFVLRGDDNVDIGLVNITSQTCSDAETAANNKACLQRTISDQGQFHAHTKWSQYATWQEAKNNNPQGSMEALLVRGSPYVTMKQEQLPLILGSPHFFMVGVCKDGVCDATPNLLNWEDDGNLKKVNTTSGQVFKIIVGADSNRNRSNSLVCKKKNAQGVCEDASPYLYSVYMVYASEPVTLAFENNKSNAQAGDSYLKTTHHFGILRSVDANNCVYKDCPMVDYTGTVRVAYVGSFPGLDDVTGKDLFPLAKEAYADKDLQKQVDLLTRHSNVYPTKADLQLSINNADNSGIMKFIWATDKMKAAGFDATQVDNQLLMMAYAATHVPAMQQSNAQQTSYKVDTLKGDMKGVVSNINAAGQATWSQTINLPKVLARADKDIWYAQHPIDIKKYQTKIDQNLENEAKLLGEYVEGEGDNQRLLPRPLDPNISKDDTYAFGKRVARLARMALVAEEMERLATDKEKYKNYKQLFANRLKQVLNAWYLTKDQIDPKDPNGVEHGYFKYDNKFGGMVSARALQKDGNPNCKNSDGNNRCGYNENFYNGQYTDHHFHYGYYLYASAVLAHIDPQWMSDYKERVNYLVRDITNPNPADPYFPQYRYFDWFEGHGMANGLGPTATGRNQESTSEAVNAWYALALWGSATNNAALRDLGKIMTAAEIRAAQTWWQITPNTGIYKDYNIVAGSHFNLEGKGTEPLAMKDLGSNGIVWELQSDGATFFGYNSWYRLGIQMIPYTPITENLFLKDWVTQNTQGPATILEDIKNTMQSRINSVQNLNDVLVAYADIRSLFKESDNTFWGAFQARINDPHTWSYLVLPIKAIAYDAQMVEQAFEQLIGAAVTVNEKVNKDTYPFKYNKDLACGLPGTEMKDQPATCIVYTYQQDGSQKTAYIPVGLPLMLTGYDGIDSGVSKTNLAWWFATRNGSSTPEIVAKPDHVSVGAVTDTSAQLAWHQSGAAEEYQYNARDKQLGALALSNVSCTGENCQALVLNLKADTSYNIEIQAVHGIVSSPWALVSSFKTKAKALQQPSGPTGLHFRPTGGASGELSWQASTDPNNAGIDYYILVKDEQGNPLSRGECTTQACVVTGLSKKITQARYLAKYRVQVWAVDKKGKRSPISELPISFLK